jgi:hypothetical protein
MIGKFTKRIDKDIQKISRDIDNLKRLNSIGGIISQRHNGSNVYQKININTLRRKLPHSIIGSGSSSGVSFLYVKIIESLSYDTDTETGRDRYWCRLITSSASDWDNSTDYSTGTIVTGSDKKLYISVDESGPSYSIGPIDPTTDDGTYWSEQSDIEVLIFHDYTTSVDMREYSPWLVVDKIYPVIFLSDETSSAYYFIQQFSYIGEPGSRTIGIDEDTKRMYACVGDTIV